MIAPDVVQLQQELLKKFQDRRSQQIKVRSAAETKLAKEQEAAKAQLNQANSEVDKMWQEFGDIEWAAQYIFELAKFKQQTQGVDSESLLKHIHINKSSTPLQSAQLHLAEAREYLSELKTKMGQTSALETVYSVEKGERYLKIVGNVKQPVGWETGLGWGCLALFAYVITVGAITSTMKSDLVAMLVLAGGFIFPLWVAWRQISSANKSRIDLYVRTVTAVAYTKGYLLEHYHQSESSYKQSLDKSQTEYKNTLTQIAQEARSMLREIQPEVAEFVSKADLSSPDWGSATWQTWNPAASISSAARLGMIEAEIDGERLSVPAFFPFPGDRSLLFEASGPSKDTAIQAIQALLIRLLSIVPPGKLRFLFIDPVGLGQNVASFMHLADYDETLVGSKAWTEQRHIEQRLTDLTEHMENVIQKYLRNEYHTIEDYNANAGEIAEPYRILVVFGFPVNFNEESARRLVSIAQNGPRCGVYTVMLADTEQPLPHGFAMTELGRVTSVIAQNQSSFIWKEDIFNHFSVKLDAPPDKELFDRILKPVGEKAKDNLEVKVPFERIAPSKDQWWKADSTEGLSIPLGPAGARKPQQLELGKGTAHHALVVGRTQSGKSTLLHVLITSSALAYSPDEVELYLIDFKKGVGFKTYATNQLPHAHVIAIESEREFGLSVLQGLDTELKRRGDVFRDIGVEHISSYRRKSGEVMPRILLLVDEFHEFFTEDDGLASQSAQILDRLVRQGAAFGIHVLLGTQTLAGAYSLARSTIDQMAVRIALQCSEADSRLILADDNPAARLLSRPGEAIYNTSNGLVEGNNRFQVAWLPDDTRDGYLKQVRELARRCDGNTRRSQIVFEGNAPADIDNNQALHDLITANTWPAASRAVHAWLGEPIALRDPVAATFRRQSGSNLLIVGQNEEAAQGILAVALVSLAVQLPTYQCDDCQFYFLDFGNADMPSAEFFKQLAGQIPNPITVGKRRQLQEVIPKLAAEAQRRTDTDEAGAPTRFLFINGLQRARDLQADDSFSLPRYGEEQSAPNLSEQLAILLRDGPDVGIHTIIWCDKVTNLNRSLDRRTLREFAMRVAFQMGTENSAGLIDTPAAGKLGQHRALFQNEEEGLLEKFRPYALPSEAWIVGVNEHLRKRQ